MVCQSCKFLHLTAINSEGLSFVAYHNFRDILDSSDFHLKSLSFSQTGRMTKRPINLRNSSNNLYCRGQDSP